MSFPQEREPDHSLLDWATWEGRWELINGIAYDMTPAQCLEHRRISMNLGASLFRVLAEAKRGSGGGECEVFAAPVDLLLGENVFKPDLVIVCDPAKKTARGIEWAPELVVEILSPRTAQKNWTHRRWAYEAAGILEHLMVNPHVAAPKRWALRRGGPIEVRRDSDDPGR